MKVDKNDMKPLNEMWDRLLITLGYRVPSPEARAYLQSQMDQVALRMYCAGFLEGWRQATTYLKNEQEST